MCSVCRCNYDDYLDVIRLMMKHIRSASHKRQIRNSKYNNEILGLCLTLFNNDNKAEVIVDDEEYLSTTIENRRAPTLEDLEPPPYKKRRYE